MRKRKGNGLLMIGLCLVTLAIATGCATMSPPAEKIADKTLLEFLEDGKTSKQMVILKLGQPSGTFDGEKVVTYRIGSEEEKGYFLLDRQPRGPRLGDWTGTKFSLVLIFDEHNILQKHSMVPVW
jgi:hypothetical protein